MQAPCSDPHSDTGKDVCYSTPVLVAQHLRFTARKALQGYEHARHARALPFAYVGYGGRRGLGGG